MKVSSESSTRKWWSMPNLPANGTEEEQWASRMNNWTLGNYLEILNQRGEFTAAEKKAMLREAAIRLRWKDNYMKHAVPADRKK